MKQGRQCSAGKASKRTNLRLFFGNVSSLSPLVLEYLKTDCSHFQILCLAEHKKARDELAATQKKFVSMGRKSWWTQARRTPDGVSGGTSVHLSKCFMAHRLDWASLPEGELLHHDPDMWTGVMVQGSSNFVIVCAYFKDGIGMCGINLAMLTEILAWIKAAGLPWLIVADWNTTPQLFLEADCMQGMEFEVVVPKDCAVTCTMGIGRVLDFVVASTHMSKLISVTPAKAPIKPHIGLDIDIDLQLLRDKVRVLRVPPIPRVVPVHKKAHRDQMGLKESAHIAEKRRRLPKKGKWKAQVEVRDADVSPGDEESSEELTWQQAKEKAATYEATKRCNATNAMLSNLTESLGFQLSPKDSVELGDEYGRMITAAEIYVASRDPFLCDKPEIAIGRAKGPRYHTRELREELGCNGPIDGASSDHEAKAWAMISSNLKLWSKVRTQSSECAVRQTKDAKCQLNINLHIIAKAAEDSKDRNQIRKAKAWSELSCTLESLSVDEVQQRIKEATDCQAAKVRKVAYEAIKGFIKWQVQDRNDHHSKGIFGWIRQATGGIAWEDYIHNGRALISNREACSARAEFWGELRVGDSVNPDSYKQDLRVAWDKVQQARANERSRPSC